MPRRRLLLALIVAWLAPLGCDFDDEEAETPPPADTPVAARTRVKTLLTQLQDPKEQAREAALAEILEQAHGGFHPRDGVRLLQEPAKRPLDWPYGLRLIQAAGQRPKPDDVPAIVEGFPHYSPQARFASLEILARLPSRDAAEALVQLIRDSAPGEKWGKGPDLPAFPLGTLAILPRHPEILFPSILSQLNRKSLRPGILQLAIANLEAGWVGEPILRSFAKQLSNWTIEGLTSLDEIDSDERGSQEIEVQNLIKVLAWLPGPPSEEALRRALADGSPAIRGLAALALTRHGADVESDAFEPVAADPSLRLWIWGRLQSLKRTDLMPARYRSQEALAESELYDWLEQSDEPGQAPEAVEFMGDFHATGPKGRRHIFLFRFRVAAPEPLAQRGWLAGTVGYPPLDDEEDAPLTDGEVSSRLDPWDARTPRGHVRKSLTNRPSPPDDEED